LRTSVAVILLSLLFYLALANLFSSFGLLAASPHRPIFQLNLLHALFPPITLSIALLRFLAPHVIDCLFLSRAISASLACGWPVIVILLVIKSYFVMNRHAALLAVGGMLVAVHLLMGILLFSANRTTDASALICHFDVDPAWVGIHLGLDVVTNALLSGCFLFAVLKQRRRFGKGKAYDMLWRQAAIYVAAIPFSNLAAAVVAWKWPAWSGFVYAADYMAASSLFVARFRSGHRWRKREEARAMQRRQRRRSSQFVRTSWLSESHWQDDFDADLSEDVNQLVVAFHENGDEIERKGKEEEEEEEEEEEYIKEVELHMHEGNKRVKHNGTTEQLKGETEEEEDGGRIWHATEYGCGVRDIT